MSLSAASFKFSKELKQALGELESNRTFKDGQYLKVSSMRIERCNSQIVGILQNILIFTDFYARHFFALYKAVFKQCSTLTKSGLKLKNYPLDQTKLFRNLIQLLYCYSCKQLLIRTIVGSKNMRFNSHDGPLRILYTRGQGQS